jgi:hypothetical protein
MRERMCVLWGLLLSLSYLTMSVCGMKRRKRTRRIPQLLPLDSLLAWLKEIENKIRI